MNIFNINPARYSLEEKLVNTFNELSIKNGKCLTIGCGNNLRYLSLTQKFDLDGVDILPPPKNIPKRFSYFQCDASSLPFKDLNYDLTIAIETFEHINKNKKAIKEVYRTLKYDGFFIMTTPTNWTWIFEFGNHGPHYYSKKDLKNLVLEAGFKIDKIFSCGGLIFWLTNILKSWLSYFFFPLLGNKWWDIIDYILRPIYKFSKTTEGFLSFPPTNWLLIARKIK